jgi:uncharacterized membrane protein
LLIQSTLFSAIILLLLCFIWGWRQSIMKSKQTRNVELRRLTSFQFLSLSTEKIIGNI